MVSVKIHAGEGSALGNKSVTRATQVTNVPTVTLRKKLEVVKICEHLVSVKGLSHTKRH